MRRIVVLVLVSFLLMLGGVVCAFTMPSSAAAATPPTGISGKATDTSGRALPGIDVTLYTLDAWGWYQQSETVQTDSKGGYKFTGLVAGTYRVGFVDPQSRYAPAFYDAARELQEGTDIAVRAGAMTNGVNARLVRYGSVSGVIKEADGTLVAEASLNLYASTEWGWSWAGSATTDVSGRYSIASVLPTGPGQHYDVQVWSGGFHDNSYARATGTEGFTLTEGQTATGIDVPLLEYEHIRGTVKGSDGKPLANMRVDGLSWDEYYGWYPRAIAYTDGDGAYDLWVCAADSYRVRFSDDAHAYATQLYGGQATEEEATPVEIAPGQTASGIDAALDLIPLGSIRGTVTGAGSSPLAGASVNLYHEYWGEPIARTTTAFDGTYSFSELTASEFAGDYHVECAAADYVTRWYDDALVAWDATAINLAPGQQAVADVRLSHPDPSCRIAGRVTDAEEAGLAGAFVQIAGAGGRTVDVTTGSDGRYSVDGLEPGTYTAYFSYYEDDRPWTWAFWGMDPEEYAGPEAYITLATHQARDDIDVVLHRYNRMSGRVTLADGTPIRNGHVGIEDAAIGFSGEYSFDEDGCYVAWLPQGTFTVSFHWWDTGDSQYYEAATDLEHATPVALEGWDGVVTDVDAVFAPPGARIEGTVTSHDDGGTDGVEVAAYYVRWGQLREAATATVVDGTYSIVGLPPRDYVLGFFDPKGRYGGELYDDAGGLSQAQWVTVAKDQVLTDRDATLGPGGEIAGTVSDSNGAPIAGVRVEAHFRGYLGEDSAVGDYIRTVVTDDDGTYAVKALSAGAHGLRFTPPDDSYFVPAWYQGAERPWQFPVTVVRDQATTGIDQQIAAGGRIAGSVTCTDGSAYTSGGQVITSYVDESGAGYEYAYSPVEADGSFLTPALRAGTYKVGFELEPPFVDVWWPDGYEYWESDLVSVNIGQTSPIAVTARREASIDGTVSEANGPIQRPSDEYNGPVTLYRQRAGGYWTDVGHSGTDERGGFTFAHLSPGTYRVRFSSWQGSAEEWWQDVHVGVLPTDIVLREGEARTGVDAFLDRYGTVSGTVVDGSGRPVQGISVTAQGFVPDSWSGVLDARWLSSAVTDDHGRYSMTVDPGTCWLRFNDGWGNDYRYTSSGSGELTVAPGAEFAGIDATLRSTWLTVTSTTHPEEYRWYNSRDVTISWTPLDPASISSYSYLYGPASAWTDTQDTSVTYAVPGDGIWWFQVNALDINGDWSGFPFTIYSDCTAPATTATGAGDAEVWSATPVRLRYQATDAHSGVLRTESSVDGGVWVKGTSCKVTADGAHTVAYRSTDNAGNVEEAQTVSFKIDRTAPTTTAAGAGDLWHRLPVTVTLTATDSASGMTGGLAGTEYSLDGGVSWVRGTSLTVKGAAQGGADGDRVVQFRSTDAVGNVESPAQVAHVYLDTKAPTTTATSAVTVARNATASLPYTVNDPAPNGGTATAWIVITDQNDQVVATLPRATVAVNAPQAQAYLCTLKAGPYRYWVKAIDAAGNPERVSGGNKLTVR